MTPPALAPVIPHPRLRGTMAGRVAVAGPNLVARARERAGVLRLEDVAGLLDGASGLAAAELWERESTR